VADEGVLVVRVAFGDVGMAGMGAALLACRKVMFKLCCGGELSISSVRSWNVLRRAVHHCPPRPGETAASSTKRQ
jgi:hypothetical protein